MTSILDSKNTATALKDDVANRRSKQPASPKSLPPAPSRPGTRSLRAVDYVSQIVADSALPVVHLPFPKLDDAIGGLPLHSLTTITASTGKGKSSIAAQIAAAHAETAPSVYYVGEMTPSYIVARIVGQRLGRSWKDVLRGGVGELEMRRVLEPLALYPVKRCADPVKAIAQALGQAHADGHTGTALVTIDYVQLLRDLSDGADMRVAMVKAIDGIKHVVEEWPVVGILLSQSSRAGARTLKEGVENAEDAAQAGAETAELENASANMLQISYASLDGVIEHDVQMLVAKGRFGGNQRIPFRYNGLTGVWTESNKLVQSGAATEIDEAILRAIDAHTAKRCYPHRPENARFCGFGLAQNRLYEGSAAKPGPHRVGTQREVVAAVKRLRQANAVTYRDAELVRVAVSQ